MFGCHISVHTVLIKCRPAACVMFLFFTSRTKKNHDKGLREVLAVIGRTITISTASAGVGLSLKKYSINQNTILFYF